MDQSSVVAAIARVVQPASSAVLRSADKPEPQRASERRHGGGTLAAERDTKRTAGTGGKVAGEHDGEHRPAERAAKPLKDVHLGGGIG
jgi:hypothetical protein